MGGVLPSYLSDLTMSYLYAQWWILQGRDSDHATNFLCMLLSGTNLIWPPCKSRGHCFLRFYVDTHRYHLCAFFLMFYIVKLHTCVLSNLVQIIFLNFYEFLNMGDIILFSKYTKHTTGNILYKLMHVRKVTEISNVWWQHSIFEKDLNTALRPADHLGHIPRGKRFLVQFDIKFAILRAPLGW